MTAPAGGDEHLVARARELTRAQGGIPSRNALKAGLRVGSDKAGAIRDRLLADQRERRAAGRRALRRLARRAVEARRRRRSLPALRPGSPPPARRWPRRWLWPSLSSSARPSGPSSPALRRPARGGLGTLPRKVATWPAQLVALPAAVAIWAGWVALGRMTAFGRVNLLPGFGDGLTVDTAITLPIGVEAYAAYAFYVALAPHAPARARRFAARSSGLAVVLGMGGQAAFHLMAAAGWAAAPWPVVTFVSCLPVAVFAMAARLVRLVRAGEVSV